MEMPSLASGAGRCQLRVGENLIGGDEHNAVALPALRGLALAARIAVAADGSATIQRLSAKLVVSVDGRALGAVAQDVHHGARIEVGGHLLTFAGQPAIPVARAAASAPPAVPVTRAAAAPATEIAIRALAVSDQPRLVEIRTGRSFPIPDGGVMIGRESGCDVVLSGPGVSRVHATIVRSERGYAIEDASANGTYVNGRRVTAPRLLRDGDVVAIHEEELRFEAATPPSGTSGPDAGQVDAATRMMPAANADGRTGEPAAPVGSDRAASRARTGPLATLDVVRGPLAGASFSVDRPVTAIGRGSQSDVQVVHESVSASHATLVLKDDQWYVVDLHSSNGTFVDGYRVAGERPLGARNVLRIGSIEMVFRPNTSAEKDRGATQRIAGLVGRLQKLW